jgi:hypothetical protein
MEIKGKIILIEDVKVISEKFKNRKFVVETEDKYPQAIQLELQQDKTNLLDNFNVNDTVECGINLRGRKWTNAEGKDMYFNTIVCWKMDKIQVQVTGVEPNNTTITDPNNENLPF